MEYAKSLARLIGQLERLPGVGPKSAQRMAFWILSHPREDAAALAEAILEVKERIRLCPVCFNFTDEEICAIDRDPRRDRFCLRGGRDATWWRWRQTSMGVTTCCRA